MQVRSWPPKQITWAFSSAVERFSDKEEVDGSTPSVPTMNVVSAQFVKDKKVLLRLDLDVSIEDGKVTEDFRLKAALSNLNLCLQNAPEVIIMGHIGRPTFAEATVGKPSVAPIWDWLVEQGYGAVLKSGKLKLLENLRFEPGEDSRDLDYAKELASYGEFYVNEAFAAYHPSASTTILPTLLPHAAGLHFAKEVEKLTKVHANPKRPLVVIIGGVKAEDKLPAISAMAKIADTVLVGGKIISETHLIGQISPNILVGKLNVGGDDISVETISLWKSVIKSAGMVVWNGPLGKIDNGQLTMDTLGSAKGTSEIARAVIESGAESIVGGGDTISLLDQLDLLDKFDFVSVGGGAMLKFLAEGTLPTIEALT